MTTYYADLHVHTAASPDGRSSLEALAAAGARAGLQALAITDHDLCTPVPLEIGGVLLIPGCEISTRAGHITGLFLTEPVDFAALGHLPEPEAAVAAIRKAGGLVGGGKALGLHLIQRYLHAPPGQLPGGLAARKARADHGYLHGSLL